MQDNLVMYERTSRQLWSTYVYMINKGIEYNNQRWILESVGDGFYKLKNKHSQRYLVYGTMGDFHTATSANRPMDHFEFKENGKGGFIIYSKTGKRPKSRGHEYGVSTYGAPNSFSVKQCQF
jgi:Ricin-type beta-trefoil lectin domain-like